ncbi:MAG: hypothetical protein PUA93_04410, partial [Eubacteriales bacterium]|nr:hypothetical protein [Eubacteriales bacterium]
GNLPETVEDILNILVDTHDVMRYRQVMKKKYGENVNGEAQRANPYSFRKILTALFLCCYHFAVLGNFPRTWMNLADTFSVMHLCFLRIIGGPEKGRKFYGLVRVYKLLFLLFILATCKTNQ